MGGSHELHGPARIRNSNAGGEFEQKVAKATKGGIMGCGFWPSGQEADLSIDLNVAYQPNPFVNPDQRGVELPAGCIDLIDLLQSVPGGPSMVVKPRPERGSLRDVHIQVAKFIAGGFSRRRFVIVGTSRQFFIQLVHRGELRLELCVDEHETAIKNAIQSVLGNPLPWRALDGREVLSVTLTAEIAAIAGILTEVLVVGMG